MHLHEAAAAEAMLVTGQKKLDPRCGKGAVSISLTWHTLLQSDNDVQSVFWSDCVHITIQQRMWDVQKSDEYMFAKCCAMPTCSVDMSTT